MSSNDKFFVKGLVVTGILGVVGAVTGSDVFGVLFCLSAIFVGMMSFLYQVGHES